MRRHVFGAPKSPVMRRAARSPEGENNVLRSRIAPRSRLHRHHRVPSRRPLRPPPTRRGSIRRAGAQNDPSESEHPGKQCLGEHGRIWPKRGSGTCRPTAMAAAQSCLFGTRLAISRDRINDGRDGPPGALCDGPREGRRIGQAPRRSGTREIIFARQFLHGRAPPWSPRLGSPAPVHNRGGGRIKKDHQFSIVTLRRSRGLPGRHASSRACCGHHTPAPTWRSHPPARTTARSKMDRPSNAMRESTGTPSEHKPGHADQPRFRRQGPAWSTRQYAIRNWRTAARPDRTKRSPGAWPYVCARGRKL